MRNIQLTVKAVLLFLGSAIVALVLTFVFAAISVSGVQSMTAAYLFLWVALAIFAIVLLGTGILYCPNKSGTVAALATVGLIVLLLAGVWGRMALANWLAKEKAIQVAANAIPPPPLPKPPKVPTDWFRPRSTGNTGVSLVINQGSHGTANPGVVTAPITQSGDCNVTQVGGSGNSASPNCESNPNKPTILYSPNGWRRWQLGPTVDIQPAESSQFQKMIDLEKTSNWQALADLSEAEIAKAPTWLSPYGLSALAFAHLCNKEFALKRANYFLEEAKANPEYTEDDFIAPARRVRDQLAQGLLPSECPKPK